MPKAFVWKERIKRAIVKGHFTRKDKLMVRQWPTCAVGEHAPIFKEIHAKGGSAYLEFERMGDAGSQLEKLGMDFMAAVDDNKPYEARRIRCAINRITV
jgi:hypothetical protein